MKHIDSVEVVLHREHRITFIPCARCWTVLEMASQLTKPERLSAFCAHIGSVHYTKPWVVDAIASTFLTSIEEEESDV